ncbi:MAG: methyltransferase [Thermoplasmata archaeon]
MLVRVQAAIPISKEGKEVYCVEPSPSMMQEIKKKRDEDPDLYSSLILIEDNAKEFDIDDDFSLIVMSGVFDHFLADENQICTLLNFNKHLVKGGTLVFDVGFGYMEEEDEYNLADTVEKDGKEYRRYIKREKKDGSTLFVNLKYETYEDGELIDTIEQRSKVGIIDKDKIHKLLNETGFEIKNEFGDYDRKTYEGRDLVCVVEAIKKE